jgi:hypothetical protein
MSRLKSTVSGSGAAAANAAHPNAARNAGKIRFIRRSPESTRSARKVNRVYWGSRITLNARIKNRIGMRAFRVVTIRVICVIRGRTRGRYFFSSVSVFNACFQSASVPEKVPRQISPFTVMTNWARRLTDPRSDCLSVA